MELAVRGDLNAFGILFDRHQARLVAFLTRFLGDRSRAEDVAQEAFWNVWRTRDTFNPRQSFRVFLYVVAKNLALNERASARQRLTVPLDTLPEQTTVLNAVSTALSASHSRGNPLDAVLHNDLQKTVRQALRQLPTEQRLCVLLHEYDQYSYPEIGRILGCSTVAARVLGFRARNRLKQLLTPFCTTETSENQEQQTGRTTV